MALLDGLFANRSKLVEGHTLTLQEYRDLQWKMKDRPFSEFKEELAKYRIPTAPSSQNVPISKDTSKMGFIDTTGMENVFTATPNPELSFEDSLAKEVPNNDTSLLSSLVNETPIENPMTEVIKNNNVPSPTSPPIAPQYRQTTPITRPDPRPMPKPSPAMPKPSPAMSVRDVAKNNNMKKVDEYQSKTDQLQAAVDKLRRK